MAQKTTISKLSSNVMKIEYDGVRSKDTFHNFFCSDIHVDNPKCNQKLFKDDLKKAQDQDGLIFIVGDLLDLMQGKKDRRSDKGSLRKEFLSSNYINDVIRYAYDILLPFKDNLVMISEGNHESSVKNHLEYDTLSMLCSELQRAGSPVQYMPYQGWVLFSFKVNSGKATHTAVKKLFYSHGNWHGVISMGTQAIRRYAAIADADIFVSGDNHERWTVGHAVYRLNRANEQIVVNQVHLKTGTYKEEFASGSGWAVEKIGMPKVLGGTHLEIKTKILTGEVLFEYKVSNTF